MPRFWRPKSTEIACWSHSCIYRPVLPWIWTLWPHLLLMIGAPSMDMCRYIYNNIYKNLYKHYGFPNLAFHNNGVTTSWQHLLPAAIPFEYDAFHHVPLHASCSVKKKMDSVLSCPTPYCDGLCPQSRSAATHLCSQLLPRHAMKKSDSLPGTTKNNFQVIVIVIVKHSYFLWWQIRHYVEATNGVSFQEGVEKTVEDDGLTCD